MKRTFLILTTLILLFCASIQPTSVKAQWYVNLEKEALCWAQAETFYWNCYNAYGDVVMCSQLTSDVYWACMNQN